MKKQKQIKNNWMFCICAAVTTAVGGFGMVNVNPVLASETIGEEIVTSNDVPDTGEDKLSENALNTGGDENLGVYDFKDNKTTGTVTVTKVWDDDKTNEERYIPDIKISTAKPSKSPVRRTEITYKARLREISWQRTTKSNNYHFCSSRVNVADIWRERACTLSVEVSQRFH